MSSVSQDAPAVDCSAAHVIDPHSRKSGSSTQVVWALATVASRRLAAKFIAAPLGRVVSLASPLVLLIRSARPAAAAGDVAVDSSDLDPAESAAVCSKLVVHESGSDATISMLLGD